MFRISVITPSLNRAAYISEAIESVLGQDYSNIEHIIVDGGSADGTSEVLKGFPHLRIISEPDQGIYDALNKGISAANGEIIGFLNTDDLYESDCFSSIIETFKKNPHALGVLGGVTIFRKDGQGRLTTQEFYSPYQKQDLLLNATLGVPLFNGWFFRKEVFNNYGLFKVQYKFASDRDFLIRLALQEFEFVLINQLVYNYRRHRGSFTFNENSNAESDFVFEFRDIAEHYLNCGKLSSRDRNCIQSWHSRITVDQALLALSTLRFGKSLNYAMHGCRYDVSWSLDFIRGCIRGASRLIRNNIFRSVF